MAEKKKAQSAKKAGSNKGNRCWPGFEPTPGSKPFEKGSCEPAGTAKKKAAKKAPARKSGAKKKSAAKK